jgi:hypothetical protein
MEGANVRIFWSHSTTVAMVARINDEAKLWSLHPGLDRSLTENMASVFKSG